VQLRLASPELLHGEKKKLKKSQLGTISIKKIIPKSSNFLTRGKIRKYISWGIKGTRWQSNLRDTQAKPRHIQN
jgi:hypothetical protein